MTEFRSFVQDPESPSSEYQFSLNRRKDMETFETVHAASFDSLGYRKRKNNRIPLPYLIRPRRKLPVYDSYALYNYFIEYSSLQDEIDSESDEDDSSVKTVASLEKGNENSATLSETDGVSAGSLTDEEYVVVEDAEVVPNFKPERVGAIQMMELSKDAAVDESESEDAGSVNEDGGSNNEDSGYDSDTWVVV